MGERGILFSESMVRAILSGDKTQTRRLVVAPGWNPNKLVFDRCIDHGERIGLQAYFADPQKDGDFLGVGCNLGRVGDRLWVRETFALIWPGESEPENVRDNIVEYRADKPGAKYPGDWPDEPESKRDAPRWRPSLHMPRWASRITLEITSVRVERLQAISGEDARDEGISCARCSCEVCARSSAMCPADASAHVEEFARFWDSFNTKPGTRWADDPFVWVLGFHKVAQSASEAA